MAKKRKTRQDKILAGLRFHGQNTSVANEQYIYTSDPHVSQGRNTIVLTQDYRYVTKDLLKTAIVTGVIICIELVLSFIVKNF